MTVLQVTHSATEHEITALVTQLQPFIEPITNYTSTHRARLVEPLVSYDSTAVALSFLPAASDSYSLSVKPPNAAAHWATHNASVFTYHHLRHDLYALMLSAGVVVESRYVVPSAHLTIGRFVSQKDHDSPVKMEAWIQEIEAVNLWLEEEVWPQSGERGVQGNGTRVGGEWLVGEGMGLDLRKGRLWYGGGETVRLGKGF